MRRVRGGVWGALVAVFATGSIVLAPAATAAPAVGSATAETVAAARADGLRVAVAVTDTTSGTTTVAGEADALFPSESVVKVLIATRLIVDGQLTGEVETAAARMISASDDEAANSLWGLVGGADVVTWVAERYGLTGLGEPSEWGWWGNTKVSAVGLAALYAALADDPVVAPWLVTQLSAMTSAAADGTDQSFGFEAADSTAALKQGWGGDDDSESTANLLSTGYVADERYAVAAIVQDPDGGSTTALVPTIDALAAAVVADTTAAEAEAEAADVAAAAVTDEEVTPAAVPTSGLVGGASGAVATEPWWPASLAVLGSAALLAAMTLGVSAVSRRRATARPS